MQNFANRLAFFAMTTRKQYVLNMYIHVHGSFIWKLCYTVYNYICMHVCNCKYKKKTINILHFVIFSVSVYIEFSASIAINCYIHYSSLLTQGRIRICSFLSNSSQKLDPDFVPSSVLWVYFFNQSEPKDPGFYNFCVRQFMKFFLVLPHLGILFLYN